MTRKEERRSPSLGGDSNQGNALAVSRVTSENTHLNMVELPLDLFVSLC